MTLSLQPAKVGALGGTIQKLLLDGQPCKIMCRNVEVPFEPSVYGGTGEETRKGLLLNISQDTFETLVILEVQARKLVTHDTWNSCLKDRALRTKINLRAPHATLFYDAANNLCGPPAEWRCLLVNALVEVKAVYSQDGKAGLIADITHLQSCPQPAEVSPFTAYGA